MPASDQGRIPLPADAERRLAAIGVNPNDPSIRTAVLIGSAFAGPLPPPDVLAEYRRVHSGLPEKIITWTEEQRRHRMACEEMALAGSEARMNRGQIPTFCLAALGLCLSAAVGVAGSAVVGSVLAVVSIGGPTAAFVLARTFNWGKSGQRSRHADRGGSP
jgi:uncharacterized membrane protein